MSQQATGRAGKPRPPGWAAVLGLLALTACWGLLLTQAGQYGVHRLLGPLSIAVLGAAICLRQTLASEHGWAPWLAAGAGAALGAVMTVSTYPVFTLVAGYLPGLSTDVAGLYQLARADPGWEGVAWTVCIVLAEEWIWREALFTNVRAAAGPRVAVAVSLALYGLVQLGTGSWVVVALGLVCGACWTAARVVSGTILTPAVAHLVWTLSVLVVRPVV
jgi:membrane protease YdiL (CAAX protease family)